MIWFLHQPSFVSPESRCMTSECNILHHGITDLRRIVRRREDAHDLNMSGWTPSPPRSSQVEVSSQVWIIRYAEIVALALLFVESRIVAFQADMISDRPNFRRPCVSPPPDDRSALIVVSVSPRAHHAASLVGRHQRPKF